MPSDDFYFPFNRANVSAEHRPLVTRAHFSPDAMTVNPGVNGAAGFTSVGFGTNWPIGLFARDMWNLWANVKMLAYHVDLAFLSNVEFSGTPLNFDNMENLNTQGVLRRCLVSTGSMFKFALKSFPRRGGNNGRSFTDDILIDYTKCFSDYRAASSLGKNLWWFPYIRFNIVGRSGQVMNGSSLSYAIDFQGLAIPPLPIEVRELTSGVPIMNPVLHRADMQVIERYDQIAFKPGRAVAGVTPVVINLPAFNPAYDGTAWRDGFVDVTEITFGGGKTTTDFVKSANQAGVFDTITVVPPVGSQTDVIRFKSVANPDKPGLTEDYYSTRQALQVTPA